MNFLETVGRLSLVSAAILCFSVSARAYDPNKPWIYSMRFMMDTWGYLEMYSTATVVSKSDNFAAFRVVTSTTNPVYQVLVTTQGNVGIGTAAPGQKLSVAGLVESTTGGFKFPDGSIQTAASAGGTSGWSGSYVIPADSYTKLLLHMDGTNGSTTFTDSAAGKTVTAHGNAHVDISQSKLGGQSAYFDGASSYLSLADSDDWNFGSGDFTIDWWAYTTTNGWLIARNDILYTPFLFSALDVYMSSNGSSWDMASGKSFGTLITNAWVHYAVVRSGNTFYAFKNGIQTDTWTSSASFPAGAAALQINRGQAANYVAIGWIDELRVSKGIARWTNNFTPPTSAYTGGTKTITITNGIITGISE